MDIQRVVDGGHALRGQSRRTVREALQILHLLRTEQQAAVRPAHDALRGADLHESPPGLDYLDPLTVFHRRDHGRLEGEILPDIEGRRCDERLGDRRGSLGP